MIISENGKQFMDNPFKKWCQYKGVKQNFTVVAHPQANEQVDVTNQTIVNAIKARLLKPKASWVDELKHILWSYQTTVPTPIRETPFSLVYRTEALIPIEVTIQTTRTMPPNPVTNSTNLREYLDQLK